MRIGVFYQDPKKIVEAYPNDCQGRDTLLPHISIKKALEARGHEVILMDIAARHYSEYRNEKVDCIFNLCDEGIEGNAYFEPHAAAILDTYHVPYTGSDFLTLGLCLRKGITKEIIWYHKIPTPTFQIITHADEVISPKLTFPLIVKPTREDGSIGIRMTSVVNTPEDLHTQVLHILSEYKQPALIEQYIEGREINVSVIGHGESATALPVSEILFDGFPKGYPRICSYEAKWLTDSIFYHKTKPQCPANVPPAMAKKIQKTALKLYNIFECRDYARVDFRVDNLGRAYVLEFNPNPDISEDAGLANAARTIGMSYSDLIENIIKSAIDRWKTKSLRD